MIHRQAHELLKCLNDKVCCDSPVLLPHVEVHEVNRGDRPAESHQRSSRFIDELKVGASAHRRKLAPVRLLDLRSKVGSELPNVIELIARLKQPRLGECAARELLYLLPQPHQASIPDALVRRVTSARAGLAALPRGRLARPVSHRSDCAAPPSGRARSRRGQHPGA